MSEATTTEVTTTDEIVVDGTELSLIDVVEDLLSEVKGDEEGNLTPYRICEVIKAVFKIYDFEKEIVPQMFYGYARNGLIVKGKKGCKRYSKDEAGIFVVKYVNRQMNK